MRVVMLIVGMSCLGCAVLLKPRPGYRPFVTCPANQIAYTFRCPGRITDGLENCNQCWRKHNKLFPGRDEAVFGCFDDYRNAYCVDFEQSCEDTKCQNSIVPAFGKGRSADGGPASPKDGAP